MVLQKLINEGKANSVIRNGEITSLSTYMKSKAFYNPDGFTLEAGDVVIRQGKKIIPEKFKELKGINLQLQTGDKIARNGKILKNVKIGERVVFELEAGDKVLRNGIYLNPEKIKINGIFQLQKDDKIYRKGKLLSNIFIREARIFRLKHGDVVERHLRDGDIVLHGRQPTLHQGSMIARKIVIRHNSTSVNSGRQIKIIGMNLAQCNSLNAK
jgi:hypothetical protein